MADLTSSGGCVAGLTSSVAERNHTGWSDHQFLTGQVMAGSHGKLELCCEPRPLFSGIGIHTSDLSE